MNRFCSASERTKAFNSADELVGTFGLLETLDDGSPKVILPFMSLQIPQLSEARFSSKHVVLSASQNCGKVKIRSNTLQTIKELSNVRSASCS